MQENDFEKQVHKKMGELRLFPSEAVWEQVEMRLHQKEKRRRWIIWFPLLLTGLFLGGYFAVNSGHISQLHHINNATNKSAKTQGGFDSDSSTSIRITKGLNNHEARPSVTKDLEKQSVPNANATALNNANSEKATKKSIKANQQSDANQASSFTNISSSNDNIKSFRHKISGNSISTTFNNYSTIGVGKEKKWDQADVQQNNNLSTILKDVPAETNTDQTDDQLESVAVKESRLFSDSINTSLIAIKENQLIKITSTRHQSRAWEWGLSFQGGKSSLSTGSLSLNKIFSGSANDALLFSSVGNQFANSANPPGRPTYLEPYPTKASAGFSAGAFIKKNLSQIFAVSIGVNYTYRSTSKIIGNKVDSSFQSNINGNIQTFDQYFRIGNTGSYTSRYHYIEIPIVLQTKISGNWKKPLYWDLGFSVSKLVASNALHFDNTTGYYYKDNTLINKTQFNITTGLPLTLASKKSFEMQAGPLLTYGLNPVFVSEVSPVKRFLFFGFKANVVLGKK